MASIAPTINARPAKIALILVASLLSGLIITGVTGLFAYNTKEFFPSDPSIACGTIQCGPHYIFSTNRGWPLSYLERTYISDQPNAKPPQYYSDDRPAGPILSRLLLDVLVWSLASVVAYAGLDALKRRRKTNG
jgi:hypothetical protein